MTAIHEHLKLGALGRVLVVLLLVLVCIAALVVARARSPPGASVRSTSSLPTTFLGGASSQNLSTGPGPSPVMSAHPGHHSVPPEAIVSIARENYRRAMLLPRIAEDEASGAEGGAEGGGASGKDSKSGPVASDRAHAWARQATWDEVYTAEHGMPYYDARRAVLAMLGVMPAAKGAPRMRVDWARLHKELRHTCEDSHEWGGNINLVPQADPKLPWLPEVVYKERSAVAPDPDGSATTGVELHRRVHDRPSMFTFHSHPTGNCNALHPSAPDYATAVACYYTGCFAGDIIVSQQGLVVYGVNLALVDMIWGALRPHYAASLYCAQYRVALDRATMFPHNFRTITALADSLGLFTVVLYQAPTAAKCMKTSYASDEFGPEVFKYVPLFAALGADREREFAEFMKLEVPAQQEALRDHAHVCAVINGRTRIDE